MILLDTNVISEMMKVEPHPQVKAWLDDQPFETLFVSSVTLAELQFGVNILAAGRRRDALATALATMTGLLADRILAFDRAAAGHFGRIAATARATGRALPVPDGYIAATAAAHGLSVATRDTGPFQAAGLDVIDPWHLTV